MKGIIIVNKEVNKEVVIVVIVIITIIVAYNPLATATRITTRLYRGVTT